VTSKVIVAIAAIASLAGGWLLYKYHIRLPLGIERDLTVLFFFACGWLFKDPIRDNLCAKGKRATPWTLIVATSVTAFVLYAAFENPVEGGDVADLYAECRQAGVKGLHLARSCMEAWHHASATMKEGDLTLLLGAGDIIELAPLARDFIIGSAPAVQTELWIGAGTNTWQSDLVTGEVYRKSESPAGRSGPTATWPAVRGFPPSLLSFIRRTA
jgi:hypothetical protein